ncbi:MAG: type II secretion system secretin GspD [Pseudomonadales bacterium]|jgi:general secretion pathway protein D|nr:type II secretion system secretin GspD [Pseudomonadales bacterium]
MLKPLVRQALALPLACCRLLAVVVLLGAGLLTHAETGSWQINLKDAELDAFISEVARITGKNFVIDPRVQGRITIVSSTPLDEEGVYELFQSVLRVHGFAAIPAGGVIKIVQQTLAKQSSAPLDFTEGANGEAIVTRVIKAENVPSNELVKILRPLIPQYGHVASVDKPNVIILSDHAENIARMEKIIQEIDVANDEQVVVVPLKEAYVDTIVALLAELAPDALGESGSNPQAVQVVANARNNSLVLRGQTEPLARLQRLIAQLDQPATRQGSTRVFRLSHADADQVATLLKGVVSTKEGGGQGDAGTTIAADPSLNAVVVRSDPSTLAEVSELLQSLDVRRTQVLIEAAIVEVALQDRRDLGVDMAVIDRKGESAPLAVSPLAGALQALLGTSLGTGAIETTQDLNLLGAGASLTNPTVAVAKLSNGISFGAVLQALSSNSDSDLLSTPSILTLDNEEASIVVGQNVPFRTGSFTTNQNGANNPFTTIQREDVGITLRVIPHIHEGDSVRLEVEQVVSSVANAGTIGASGFSDIVTNKRTINTVILAEDAQTIVLGGLIQDDTQESIQRVPLLSSLPLAGKLFRSTSTERVKRNLLVFLRPTILRDTGDVEAITTRKAEGIWRVNPEPKATAEAPPIDGYYEGRNPSSP